MKKYTLLIIIGGIFLIGGIILYNGKKDQIIYYTIYEMSKEEAKALVVDKTKLIMDIYENVNETFKVEENKKIEETPETEEKENTSEEYVKVSNYDDVVNSLFTEKGKEELEGIKFNDKLFVSKKDDVTYILSKIPSNNSYLTSSIFVDNITITDDKVKATVSFTSDKVDNDSINYYVYEKDIILVKIDDKWFVDTFMYPNV